jgi:hypothetical protein
VKYHSFCDHLAKWVPSRCRPKPIASLLPDLPSQKLETPPPPWSGPTLILEPRYH